MLWVHHLLLSICLSALHLIEAKDKVLYLPRGPAFPLPLPPSHPPPPRCQPKTPTTTHIRPLLYLPRPIRDIDGGVQVRYKRARQPNHPRNISTAMAPLPCTGLARPRHYYLSIYLSRKGGHASSLCRLWVEGGASRHRIAGVSPARPSFCGPRARATSIPGARLRGGAEVGG